MNVFRIAAPDLSIQDRLVLRAALRLVGTGSSWSCIDDAALADVVVRRLTPIRPDDRDLPPLFVPEPQWALLDINAPACVDAPMTSLILPLRSRDLLPQLRLAEAALLHLAKQRGGSSPPRGFHAALVESLLGHDGPLGHAPVLMRIGENDTLLIECCDPTQPNDVRNLRWSSRTVGSLAFLCELIRLDEAVLLEAAPTGLFSGFAQAPLCQGNVGQLIWALTAHDPHPELMPSLRSERSFGLLRWPDVRGLSLNATHLRLAAVLARGGVSLSQLTERAGASEDETVAFVNACHGLGHLAIGQPIQAIGASAPRPARVLGALVESIRAALRVVVAKDLR